MDATSQIQGAVETDIKQFKDFLMSYNELAERCFRHCIIDFTSRKVSKSEDSCSSNCMDKYLKMTQRVSTRFQEYQLQQNEAAVAVQKSGVLASK